MYSKAKAWPLFYSPADDYFFYLICIYIYIYISLALLCLLMIDSYPFGAVASDIFRCDRISRKNLLIRRQMINTIHIYTILYNASALLYICNSFYFNICLYIYIYI